MTPGFTKSCFYMEIHSNTLPGRRDKVMDEIVDYEKSGDALTKGKAFVTDEINRVKRVRTTKE